MTLSAGTRLGTYEILAPIGAGGMGEVYPAKDISLGRGVAIKVLPPAVSADPDRLRRFEQEARSATPDGKSYAYTASRVLASDLYVVSGLK